MHARLIKFINDLSASYWFVPMCMVLGAMLLGLGLGWLDASQKLEWIPWKIRATADDARTILSVVATAILGVAGVTFSITMVAVSFASSNYGPRLINNFMRDKGSQYTLGTFIGTFVYCLTVLTNLHGPMTSDSGQELDAFIPNLSISMALLLTFCSISMLIFYIHHITETINIENIISGIGHNLKNRITELFPNRDTDIPMVDDVDFDTAIHGMVVQEICAESIGYIQTIDMDSLSKLAREKDLLISIHYRPGDFTTTHDRLMSIWTSSPAEIPQDALRECIATGQERTEHQNLLFLVEQLSEVIARALSPGINDPYTAISCMNWFRTALMEFLYQGNLTAEHPDEGQDEFDWNRARIQLRPVEFSRVCSVMFDHTRQYVAADRNTTLHALALIGECAWHAGPGPARELLLTHLLKLHDCSIGYLSDTREAADITQRYEDAMRIVTSEIDINRIRTQTAWFGGSA